MKNQGETYMRQDKWVGAEGILLVQIRRGGEVLRGQFLKLTKLHPDSVWKVVLDRVEANERAPLRPHIHVLSAHRV